MTFQEWEKEQGISGVSPEAYYAELAYNAGYQAGKGAAPTQEEK